MDKKQPIFKTAESYQKERMFVIKKEIDKAETISIFIHVNPDGDCIGSALALCRQLVKMGKTASVYCDDVIPDKFNYLPYLDYIKKTNEHQGKVDLAISVDIASLDRMGGGISPYMSAKKQIMIDHHVSRGKFADIALIDAHAAACGEIIFKFIQYLRGLDDEIAVMLFTAIVTDTGCFQFSNTTNETLSIVQELRKFKLDPQEIIYNAFSSIGMNVFNLKQRVLNKVKFYDNNTIGIITYRKEDFEATGTNPMHTEGIISSVRNIMGIKVAVSICETENLSWKISFRGVGDIDVSDMAAVFGGGGHKGASGCRISGYYEDVLERILKVVRDYM